MAGWPTAYLVIALGDADELPTDADIEALQEHVDPLISHVVRGPTANRITLELVSRLGGGAFHEPEPDTTPTTRGR